jgi:ribonuclease VapC
MVIDSSAILAILQGEPEKDTLLASIAADETRLTSAVSVLEAGMLALSRRGHAGRSDLEQLLSALQIDVVEFDAAQARIGVDAFARFGKGRHKAALNLGDCAVYALARASGEPLLFKGGDFAQTDVTPALP